jgi:hypothetical protein
MLAPGHIAAGYLTAKIALKIIKPDLNTGEIDNLLLWGAIFGAAPDLDLSYNTLHPAKKTINLADCRDDQSHRKHFTHAPLIWLAAFLVILSIALAIKNVFSTSLAILLWFCSWTHFALDSLEDGIRWFWPFNKKFFRVKNIELLPENTSGGNLDQFFRFLKQYTKKFKLTFYLEIVLVLAALTVYFLKV